MKRISKGLVVLLSVLLCFSVGFGAVSAADFDSSSNHYNVMLVVDGSGSMTWTDSQNWRYEAINQFIGLLSQRGNSLGAVVFDQKIELTRELSAIEGKADKEQISDAIQNYVVDKYGDTNIGLALETAVSMLQEKGNPELPSVVVLLSDGNTDLSEADALKESLDQKANAIDMARDADIPIYTVCLNEDGSANSSELRQISDATGGNFEEVSDAQDLKNVFQSFYNLIYGASTKQVIPKSQLDETGIIEADFHVSAVCVEEVNIVVDGNVSGIELTKPDGTTVSESELAEMTTASKSFTLVKIVDPDPGNWHIALHGKPGDTIQVDIVYNTDFKVTFSLEQQEDIPVNTAKTFSAVIYDGGEAVTGKEIYKNFDAVMTVKNNADGTAEQVKMKAGADGFTTDYTFEQLGTYMLSVSVQGETFSQQTEPVMVSIGNTAPYLSGEDTLTKKIYLLPFSDKESQIDLSGMAKDAEDSTLRYEVASTAFLPEDYELSKDGMLTMKEYSVSKGSFTINAYDSMGAYCSFTVKIVTVNVALWTLILIGAAALITAAILGLLLWIALQKPFAGTCYAQSMVDGEYSQWSELRKARGRIRLSSFGIELPQGISGNAYLQASGKNYVTLVSKTPFFCRGQMVKEVRITSFDVEIRADQNSMDSMWIHFHGRMK